MSLWFVYRNLHGRRQHKTYLKGALSLMSCIFWKLTFGNLNLQLIQIPVFGFTKCHPVFVLLNFIHHIKPSKSVSIKFVETFMGEGSKKHIGKVLSLTSCIFWKLTLVILICNWSNSGVFICYLFTDTIQKLMEESCWGR